MRTLGTYGSHLEIQAWARLTGRKINIIQPGLVYVVDDADETPQGTSSNSSSEDAEDDDYYSEYASPRELRSTRREGLVTVSGSGGRLTSNGKATVKRIAVSTTEELDETEGDGPLYIVYHDWEHYSSARNIDGPHAGPPRIVEVSDVVLPFCFRLSRDNDTESPLATIRSGRFAYPLDSGGHQSAQ
jgi:hypothetical protein